MSITGPDDDDDDDDDLSEIADLSNRVLVGVDADSSGQDGRDAGEWCLDLDRRRAALLVRRAANQHNCPGKKCRHPDHPRDVHFAATLIDMLDLPREYPVVTDDERADRYHRPVDGVREVKQRADRMRGR